MIAIIAAAITLAEARACPMLALLHALICHLWCAAHETQPSKSALVSSPRLGSNDTTSSPQQQLQPGQQQGEDLVTATDAKSESSGSSDAAVALADTLQQHCMQIEAEDLSGRRHGMPDRQHGVVEGQPGVFDGQPDQQQQHQQAPLQTLSAPSAREGVSHQHQMQAVHCEMLVCAIALQVLPCVAWLKQLPHTRQLAAWQDAVPCAVLALHASTPAMAVSVSLLVYSMGTECSNLSKIKPWHDYGMQKPNCVSEHVHVSPGFSSDVDKQIGIVWHSGQAAMTAEGSSRINS